MGISIWQLVIILAIVVLLFGTKKLRNMGGDLGSAIKNFKGAIKDGESEAATSKLEDGKGDVIEGSAEKEKDRS